MGGLDSMTIRRAVTRTTFAVVAIDVLLFVANLVGDWSFVDLDQEKNFSTWYSSTKLLGVALAATWCMTLEPDERRRGVSGWLWPGVAALFVALSMDETSTAHERLAAWLMSGGTGETLRNRLLGGDASKDAFAWPVLFAPLVIALVYFLATALYSRMKHDRSNLWLGIAGCGCFVAAVLLEGPVIYDSPPMTAWGAAEISRYRLFTLFEESLEIAGATLMLVALLRHATMLASRDHTSART